MSLNKGDHVVIKRNGLILTPDGVEAYHEFEVIDNPVAIAYHADGCIILEPGDTLEEGNEPIHGYAVKLRVIR